MPIICRLIKRILPREAKVAVNSKGKHRISCLARPLRGAIFNYKDSHILLYKQGIAIKNALQVCMAYMILQGGCAVKVNSVYFLRLVLRQRLFLLAKVLRACLLV